MNSIYLIPGPLSINPGEHNGCRIDGPDGRAVAHTIQRDPHPAFGQGITQAQAEAAARLFVAAPELLEVLTMGQTMDTPTFMDWLADRLVAVYGEKPSVDFVLSLRERAKAGRAAIAKATGAEG